MKDDTFELLSKMYGEFSEFRVETNERLDGIETKFDKLHGDVLRVEQDHGKKLQSLFDRYQQTYEKIEIIEEKIDDLSDKVDKHDINIR